MRIQRFFINTFRTWGRQPLWMLRFALLSLLASCNLVSAANRSYYYRYYEQNGTATVSQIVTDKHIKKGYEVLDQRMQPIKTVPAYDPNAELLRQQLSPQHTQQKLKQQQLLRAYGNVSNAQAKKRRQLGKLYAQLATQYRLLQVLFHDNARLQQLRANHYRHGLPQPNEALYQLQLNQTVISKTSQRIQGLEQDLQQQAQFYDEIIRHLP